MSRTVKHYADWPREGKGMRGAYILQCERCGGTDKFKPGNSFPIAEGVVERMFARRGWKVNGTGVGYCGHCLHKRPSLKEDQIVVQDKKVLHMVSPPEPPPVVEPQLSEGVRTPTREQNRAIRDMLDNHYDEDKQRYKGSCSDAVIADKLKFPRKWVSDIREQFCGPDDVNELSAEMVAELTELKTDMTKIESNLEGCLTQLEALKNRVKDVEAKMKRGH
jgi:hypothetical protein